MSKPKTRKTGPGAGGDADATDSAVSMGSCDDHPGTDTTQSSDIRKILKDIRSDIGKSRTEILAEFKRFN